MVTTKLNLSMTEPQVRQIYAKQGDTGRVLDITLDQTPEDGTLRILRPDGTGLYGAYMQSLYSPTGISNSIRVNAIDGVSSAFSITANSSGTVSLSSTVDTSLTISGRMLVSLSGSSHRLVEWKQVTINGTTYYLLGATS